MKRTGWFIFIIGLMFLLNPFYYIKPLIRPYFAAMFILDLMLIFIMVREPYWKKGAWLVYFAIVEFLLYLTNIVYFRKLIVLNLYLNQFTIFCALVVVIIAHMIKDNQGKKAEDVEEFEDYVDNNSEESNKQVEDKESAQEEDSDVDEEPTDEIPKKKDVEFVTYFMTKDNIVHIAGCIDLKDNKDMIATSSKRYAQSKKFKPCTKGNPF